MTPIDPQNLEISAYLPMVSIVPDQGLAHVYLLLEVPHGEVCQPQPNSNEDNYIFDIVSQTGARGGHAFFKVAAIPVGPPHQPVELTITVSKSGATLRAVKVLVENDMNLLITGATTNENHHEYAPFVYCNVDDPERPVLHFNAFLPESYGLSLNKINIGNVPAYNLEIASAIPGSEVASRFLYRNSICLEAPVPPFVLLTVKEGGKTKKVMVSTDDGSIGTGGGTEAS